MRARKIIYLCMILGLIISLSLYGLNYFQTQPIRSKMPIIAIANYGPHSSLQASIRGIKEELTKQGFIENKTVHYEMMDVSFETALIPQMIARLKQFKPTVIVAMTTPVAQFTKHSIRDIPIIYNVITDPVAAGLIQTPHKSDNNITGSSDKQDLSILLQFAKSILPNAKTIGMLYAPSEANDVALVKMMKEAALKLNMQVVAVPIDHVRDIAIRMQAFKNKVDFIYIGASGPIQPALPAIAKSADTMGIPVFNVEPDAVHAGLVLASFGVNYKQVGKNAGKLIARLLNQQKIAELDPIYPDSNNHQGFISLKKAKALGITLPPYLSHITIVE